MRRTLILVLALLTAPATGADDPAGSSERPALRTAAPDGAPGIGTEKFVPEVFGAGSVDELRVVRGQSEWGLSEFGDEVYGAGPSPPYHPQRASAGVFRCEFLPRDSLYPFYLADVKASRMAAQIVSARDDNTLGDGTLGGRFGVFRYADDHPVFPIGLQLDIEAAALVRLDFGNERDLRSSDFRAGVPLSVSFGRFQTRFGYYHLSSHVGDEFLLRNHGFERLNYSRDALFLGGAYWLTERSRVYGEAGWSFYDDVAEPWEFQFGVEHAPRQPTGVHGAPFFAVGGHMREEVDFGGGLTVQGGWAWRSASSTGLLRTGLHYYNGKSHQYSFHDDHEELIGLGMWYDF